MPPQYQEEKKENMTLANKNTLALISKQFSHQTMTVC